MGAPVRRQAPDATRAADELYGVPLRAFTAERKRMTAELAAAGEKDSARRVAALARPSVAAWVVNRLWREARGELEALFALGNRMRAGDGSAWQEQRALLARLGTRAGEILRGDRHAVSPATLRRVGSTLQSLSAAAGFGADEPGQLVADRDAPGFEVLGGELPPPPPTQAANRAKAAKATKGTKPPKRRDPPSPRVDRAAQAAEERARRRREKAQRRADALEAEVADLRAEQTRTKRALARVQGALEKAELALEETRAELQR